MNAEAEESKIQGNECMKNDKFFEAILHYTKAIKLESDNPPFYSNRSLAFLKIQQYNYALEDAKTVIKLMPKWMKGYFRKGEVEYQTEHYEAAMESYSHALEIVPGDKALEAALTKAVIAYKKQKKAESRVTWLGAGVGLLLGIAIVLSDQYVAQTPVMQNEYVQMILMISFIAICTGCAWIYRFFMRAHRASLLDPPANLLDDDTKTPGMPGAEIPIKKTNKRGPNQGSKSHGNPRQRSKQKK